MPTEFSIKFNLALKAKVFFGLAIILILLFIIQLPTLPFAPIKAKAVTTSFGTGQVYLEKFYIDNNTEVKTVTTGPGDYITVKLKYSNSNSQSAISSILSDSLPNSKFSYVQDSLQNCLINENNCISIGNSLFSGLNFQASPSAGFYGSTITSAAGNLEIGKKQYLHAATCSNLSQDNEIFLQSANNSSIFSPSCSSISGSSTVLDYTSFQLLGQRYIHQTTCTQASGEKEIFIQSIDNNNSFTGSCSSLGVSASLDSTTTLDILDSANSVGYIQYQMKSNTNEDYSSEDNIDLGDYGANPSLSSASFATITDSMENSISLKVFCDTLSPSPGERNILLSDAEIRAGQDFRCNYQASICPVVFEDLNTNGTKENDEPLISGVDVQLQSFDGNTVYSTINTNNSSQCFNNLLHGRQYKVVVPLAPIGNNTTGGNTLNYTLSYQESGVIANFGYGFGSLVLNTPSSINFPSLTVSVSPTDTIANIFPIQVIDTRISNPGWSLSAVVSNFESNSTVQAAPILISNAFDNQPESVTINDGQTQGINIGDRKKVNSTDDIMSIFQGTAGFSKGNYSINSRVTLTVPAYIRATTYGASYTFTII